MRFIHETDEMDGIIDACLLAQTQAYIQSLEVCSLCGRVTPCRPLADGWQCINRVNCVLSRSRDPNRPFAA